MTEGQAIPDAPEQAQAPIQVPQPPSPPVLEAGPTIASLAASVRKLRIWLTILTVLVALLLLASCGSLGYMTSTFGLMSGMPRIEAEEIDRTRGEIEDALGDRIEDLEVRAVSITYGEPGFPFSVFSGSPDEESLYVEYRHRASGVVVADLVGGPFGMDAASSGLIPTKGSLVSRMTDEQYDRLMAAYAAETSTPLGPVRRYNDIASEMMDGTQPPDEVRVGDITYPSGELWKATEGRMIRGDSIDVTNEMGTPLRSFIFHEDPKTGEFKPLGTEPAETWW